MIQCSECEFCQRQPSGEVSFRCDPFGTVKEPECLMKWQIIKVNQMVATYQATLEYYRKLAPMQEKMFKVVQRELDDMNEAEKWKAEEDEGPEGNAETDEPHDFDDEDEDGGKAGRSEPWR